MDNFCIASVFIDEELGFLGNNAAVLELDKELSKEQLQVFAADINQPATTFLIPLKEGHYQVHWFAPDGEIDLCGHGSLAAAVYLKEFKGETKATLHFTDGHVKVGFKEGNYFLWIEPIEIIDHLPKPEGLAEALGIEVHDYFSTSNKDIVLVKSEDDLRRMKPDFERLAKMEAFGYAVTAPGKEVDFVSRTLVPKVQQLEDHATGSSHAVLTPFWSERLMKKSMKALQLSPRGGAFTCEMHMNQVLLKGQGRLFVKGEFRI
jgi:PhzF family phenazine biosynthesis protein